MAILENIGKREASRSRSSRRGRSSLPKPIDKGKEREPGNQASSPPILVPNRSNKGKEREPGNRVDPQSSPGGSNDPVRGSLASPRKNNRGQQFTRRGGPIPPNRSGQAGPPDDPGQENSPANEDSPPDAAPDAPMRGTQAHVQDWRREVEPLPRQSILRIDSPERLKESLKQLHTAIPNPYGPNLEGVSDQIVALVRP